MTAVRLHALLDRIAPVPPNLAELALSGLRLDSRAIEAGEGFVALAGARVHGLEHAEQALARGAACVLYETPLPPALQQRVVGLPGIAVPQLRRHLPTLADRVYRAPARQLTTIGVTGTNGKTSTVHLLAQALAAAGCAVATIGTLGCGRPGALIAGERTTPDVLAVHAMLRRFVDEGVDHVAMEVSSHALDQGRVDGVGFAIAVFTNLSRDHLDYHLDMQAYGEAKARLFQWPGLRTAVINTDDAFGRDLLDHIASDVTVLRCGCRALADAIPEFQARHIEPTADGLRFTLVTPDGEAEIGSRLLGRFNVANLLGVAACLHALGWSLARIVALLPTLDSVPGRMNRFGGGNQPLVVVDYAHTPDALEQTLATLREHRRGELICVFGCGGERDAGKRPQMAAAAQRHAERIIVTDDNPRGEDGDAIVADILAGFESGSHVQVERDRARAIAQAIAGARAGDIVVVAGKGHEPYQEIAGRRLPFDDAVQVRAALEGWRC